MKKYGIRKYGELIERFDDPKSAVKRLKELGDVEGIGFGQLQFNELTEEERLQTMEEKLSEVVGFAESMKGLGMMNNSSTRVNVDEIRWLIDKSKKCLSSKRKDIDNDSELMKTKYEKDLESRKFEELNDIEKIQLMEFKLEGLIKFLNEMQASGQTYYSSLNIETNEFSWFVENARMCVSSK